LNPVLLAEQDASVENSYIRHVLL